MSPVPNVVRARGREVTAPGPSARSSPGVSCLRCLLRVWSACLTWTVGWGWGSESPALLHPPLLTPQVPWPPLWAEGDCLRDDRVLGYRDRFPGQGCAMSCCPHPLAHRLCGHEGGISGPGALRPKMGGFLHPARSSCFPSPSFFHGIGAGGYDPALYPGLWAGSPQSRTYMTGHQSAWACG